MKARFASHVSWTCHGRVMDMACMKTRLASHSPPRDHCSQRGSPSAARACGGVSWARRGRVVISSRVAVGSVRRSLGLEPLGLPRRNPVPLRRRAVEAGAERVVEQRLRDMSRKGRGKSRKGKGERVVEERLRDTRDGSRRVVMGLERLDTQPLREITPMAQCASFSRPERWSTGSRSQRSSVAPSTLSSVRTVPGS